MHLPPSVEGRKSAGGKAAPGARVEWGSCPPGRARSAPAAPAAPTSPPRRRAPPAAQEKDDSGFELLGGVEGLASALHSSLANGIEGGEADLESRRAAFGANRFKQIPPKSFFGLWFEQLKDPTLIMLMCAAAVRRPAPRAGGLLLGSWRRALAALGAMAGRGKAGAGRAGG